MANRRGTRRPPVVQSILKKNGTRHFSFNGRHVGSVGCTEPVFELDIALSENRPTYEIRSDSGILYRVIVLTSQVATFLPEQRCQVTES